MSRWLGLTRKQLIDTISNIGYPKINLNKHSGVGILSWPNYDLIIDITQWDDNCFSYAQYLAPDCYNI